MAVDVVGYSRLMGRDESGTLARLKVSRAQHFEPALARHGGRLACSFEDLGPLALRHIDRPVRAFRVAWSASDWLVAALPKVDSPVAGDGTVASLTPAGPVLALPDKPSIAVLPFANMSDDAGQ